MECPHCGITGEQNFRLDFHKDVRMMSTSCVMCGDSFNYTSLIEPPPKPRPVAQKTPEPEPIRCSWEGCKAVLHRDTKGGLCYKHRRAQDALDRLARRDQTHNLCAREGCDKWTKKPETLCYPHRLEEVRLRRLAAQAVAPVRICIGYKKPCRDQVEISRTNKSGRCRRCDGLKRSDEHRLKKLAEKKGAGHGI